MTHAATAYTQACEDRDFQEWHQGCPWCAVWVVRLDIPPVQTMLHNARARMLSHLLPHYARQAHITVAYRGLMAGAQPHANAAFASAHLQRDIACLQASAVAPFNLQLQGAGSFSTVPYLGVAAQPALHALHDALSVDAPYPGWEYVPHVTIGHYGVRIAMQKALQPLQSLLGSGVWWHGEIDTLWLARYRTHDIAGALSFEGRFDLRTQTYDAHPGALLHADLYASGDEATVSVTGTLPRVALE